MRVPRILLADDHELLTSALRSLLEPRCVVVGTAADGRELLESARVLHPDIAIIDISMPLLNGLEAGRQLKAKTPLIKLLYLTMNEDPDFAKEALGAGASAYLLKKSAASELFHAIDEVMKGNSYITPQIAKGLEDAFIRDPDATPRRRTLTPRQRQVAQLLAEGKSFKEAAAILNVTPRAIAFHKYSIMENLQLKSSADLVRFAVREHIVST